MEKYILIPHNILMDDNMSDSGFRVYGMLLNYAYDNIFCYPTIEQMAEKLGKSERTIMRGVKELREGGYVKIFKEDNERNNVYIIMPSEWDRKVVEDGIIEDREDFESVIEEIRKYYEEIGRDVILAKNKVKRKKKTKTHIDYMKEIDDKIDNENYEFDVKEIAYIFEWANREYRNHSFNINWGRDLNAIRTTFGIKDVYGKFEMMMVLKYVENYDLLFKAEKYPHPTLWGLSRSWQYDKIKVLVEREMRVVREDNEDVVDIVF